jgi:DNA repair protein RecO (recombination protein O)
MSVLVTKGIVLRYANYRETSRILTLFSRDLGRITVSAKGCMRPKCRERAATEMFTLGEYTLSERAGRYYLNGASIEDPFYNLRLDIDRLAYGAYFTDICRSVLNEGDPQPELFDLLAAALKALCQDSAATDYVRLFFEAKAMDILGFRPEVESCAACGSPLGEKLWFSISAGGTVCGECIKSVDDGKPMLPGAAAFLRQVMDWEISRMAVLKPSEFVLNNLDQTFRPFLAWHLERTYKLDGFMNKLKGTKGLDI